ncbi:hypothetical protein ACF0H5_020735 [Mactra antiquata]
MGCFLSKCRSSLINKNEAIPPVTRVQRIDKTNNNGIERVPRLNLESLDEPAPTKHGNAQRQMRPPPPAPSSSPPQSILSPKPILTGPPTPENGKLPFDVHFAEDLSPVSDIQPCTSKHYKQGEKQSSLTVSDVMVKPALHRTHSTRREEELSIEELDTDIDDYSRLSINRYRDGSGRFNPSTTDILLPARKHVDHNVVPDNTSKVSKKVLITEPVENKSKESNKKSRRKDTPIPKHLRINNGSIPRIIKRPGDNFNKILEHKSEVPNLNVRSNDRELKDLKEASKGSDQVNVHDANNATKDNISINVYTYNFYNENKQDTHNHDEDDEISKLLDNSIDNSIDKPEGKTFTDTHKENNDDSTTILSATPHRMFDNESEKKRQTRKRKRGIKKRNEHIPGKIDDTGTARTLSTALRRRPDSVCSNLTTDSKQSLDSIDNLNNSYDMDANPLGRRTLETSSTPIGFKSFMVDAEGEPAEIVDLEAEGDDPANDSWLENDKPQDVDAWYGVKPYEVVANTSIHDGGVIQAVESGPSSNDKITKQKLLYSRFARRPQSDYVARGMGKPPLPPGAVQKIRPVSDTGQRSQFNSSRYFTTDLDIHW